MKTQKFSLKYSLIFTVFFALIVLLWAVGCSSTPYGWERRFYTITTNTTPQIVTTTNTVYLTNTVEHMVLKTNFLAGVPEIRMLPMRDTYVSSESVVTFSTNNLVSYTYTANTNAGAVTATLGTVANVLAPGSGGMVAAIAGGVVGLWGALRSRKLKKTAGVLAQGIEVYGETVKNMGPLGQKVDGEVKGWMQGNQAENGVLSEVQKLLRNIVDKREAKDAAEGLPVGPVTLEKSA